MITMQVTGPRGSVRGKPMKDERGARASAMGTYSSTFGREALKAAKGKLRFSIVRGNPAPKKASSTSKPKASKASGTTRAPSRPALPFTVPAEALKEGKKLVIGLDGRRRPVFVDQVKNLTEGRAVAASATLPKSVKYRLVVQVCTYPGVYEV